MQSQKLDSIALNTSDNLSTKEPSTVFSSWRPTEAEENKISYRPSCSSVGNTRSSTARIDEQHIAHAEPLEDSPIDVQNLMTQEHVPAQLLSTARGRGFTNTNARAKKRV